MNIQKVSFEEEKSLIFVGLEPFKTGETLAQ